MKEALLPYREEVFPERGGFPLIEKLPVRSRLRIGNPLDGRLKQGCCLFGGEAKAREDAGQPLLMVLYYLRHVSQHKKVLQSTQLHLEESKGEAERQNQVIQTMQERMDRMDAQLGKLDELETKKKMMLMERRMLVQEKLEEVEAYQKLLCMVNDAEHFGEVHTRMEEMDWTQLMRYVDSQMDNICLRLFSEKTHETGRCELLHPSTSELLSYQHFQDSQLHTFRCL